MKIYLHYYCSCLFLRNSTATNLCIYNVSFLLLSSPLLASALIKVLLASVVGLCIVAIYECYFNSATYSPIRQGNHYLCVIFVGAVDLNHPRAIPPLLHLLFLSVSVLIYQLRISLSYQFQIFCNLFGYLLCINF